MLNSLQDRVGDVVEASRWTQLPQQSSDMTQALYEGFTEFIAGIQAKSRSGRFPRILDGGLFQKSKEESPQSSTRDNVLTHPFD